MLLRLNSGQQVIAKRLFQPWYQHDFIWNLTSYAGELQSYQDYGSLLVDRILASERINPTGERTFVGRLMRISDENPTFNIEDVKSETTTLLFGVMPQRIVWNQHNTFHLLFPCTGL